MNDHKIKTLEKKQYKGIVALLMKIGGIIAVFLGLLGVFLPLLPTTPFLLLASWLFIRSSDKLNNRLMQHKILGPFLHNYQSGKGISKRDKIYGLGFTYVILIISFIFSPPLWYIRVILASIAIGVTYHVLSRKTAE